MPRAANTSDLDAIKSVIRSCVMNRPVSERVKKLTLPSLYLEPGDFDFMTIWIAGEPIAGVLALQEIDEGMLLHSLYVDPSVSGQGVGSQLARTACELTRATNQRRLIVKAFPEAVGFFEKVGFTKTNIIDYPHALAVDA